MARRAVARGLEQLEINRSMIVIRRSMTSRSFDSKLMDAKVKQPIVQRANVGNILRLYVPAVSLYNGGYIPIGRLPGVTVMIGMIFLAVYMTLVGVDQLRACGTDEAVLLPVIHDKDTAGAGE